MFKKRVLLVMKVKLVLSIVLMQGVNSSLAMAEPRLFFLNEIKPDEFEAERLERFTEKANILPVLWNKIDRYGDDAIYDLLACSPDLITDERVQMALEISNAGWRTHFYALRYQRSKHSSF